MKSLTHKLLLAGMLFIAGTAATFAQQRMECNRSPEPPPCPDPGITSVISGGILGGSYTLRTQGTSTFDILAGFCCPSTMRPSGWTGTGTSSGLGNVTWSFDLHPSLPTPPLSTLKSTATGCVGDLYFWITGTLQAFPGRTYRSMNWVHIQNPNVRTCNPFRCETFRLVGAPVRFEDLSKPGSVAFTLDNLIVTLDN